MLGGVALAVVFAVICLLLGRWQWGRYEDKQVKAAAVTDHYTAAPVDLATVAGRLPLGEDEQWLRVTTTGRYAASQQLLFRNRALDGTAGLEVLVPLDLDGTLSGRRLLVDRGWVQNADSASQLPAVPPAPSGEVTVQGWLRAGEADLGKDLPAGQLASISVPEAQAQTGGQLLDGYLVLQSEATPAGVPARPTPLEAPDTDLGPHQAYAFQWWLTSVFGFVLVGYRLRVAAADERERKEEQRRTGGTQSPGGGPERQPVPAKARKVRIWDEEDG
jgi:cytochrome oxidase assembly protein ShyY1